MWDCWSFLLKCKQHLCLWSHSFLEAALASFFHPNPDRGFHEVLTILRRFPQMIFISFCLCPSPIQLGAEVSKYLEEKLFLWFCCKLQGNSQGIFLEIFSPVFQLLQLYQNVDAELNEWTSWRFPVTNNVFGCQTWSWRGCLWVKTTSVQGSVLLKPKDRYPSEEKSQSWTHSNVLTTAKPVLTSLPKLLFI